MKRYRVTRRAEDLWRITLRDGDSVRLSIDNGGGIFSDGQLVLIDGSLAVGVDVSHPQLCVLDFLWPDVIGVALETVPMKLSVYANLTGELSQEICFHGALTVRRVLDGADQAIGIMADTPHLTNVFLLRVSDWSDSRMDQLADLVVDDMIYREV